MGIKGDSCIEIFVSGALYNPDADVPQSYGEKIGEFIGGFLFLGGNRRWKRLPHEFAERIRKDKKVSNALRRKSMDDGCSHSLLAITRKISEPSERSPKDPIYARSPRVRPMDEVYTYSPLIITPYLSDEAKGEILRWEERNKIDYVRDGLFGLPQIRAS